MVSGFWEVTRWPPRTCCSAERIFSLTGAGRSRMRCASPPASAAASSRCSVETYSSLSRLASSSARSRSWRARGSSDRLPPWIAGATSTDGCQLEAEGGRVGAERRSVTGGDASGPGAARRAGVRRRGPGSRRLARRWAARMASCAFSVKRSSFTSATPPGSRRVPGPYVMVRWWLRRGPLAGHHPRCRCRVGRCGRGTPWRLATRRRGGSARLTRALTRRSPWPSPRNRGRPWPLSRNARPRCVPSGTRNSSSLPVMVSTGTSEPRRAWRRVRLTSRDRSAPSA